MVDTTGLAHISDETSERSESIVRGHSWLAVRSGCKSIVFASNGLAVPLRVHKQKPLIEGVISTRSPVRRPGAVRPGCAIGLLKRYTERDHGLSFAYFSGGKQEHHASALIVEND